MSLPETESPVSLHGPGAIPTDTFDEINCRILAVSEDKVQGFLPDPLGEIAAQSGLSRELVIARIQAMLRTGTIRRVRQTLLATSLAKGALVAWAVPEERLETAFEWMFTQDPFTGHAVIRSTDAPIQGARYRLWTTLKVPEGQSLERHCDLLCEKTGATAFQIMPALRLFALGVGHVRRRDMEIGAKSDELAEVIETHLVHLSPLEWKVLLALKREFEPEELTANMWAPRAAEAGVSLEQFLEVAGQLSERGVIGRFSTFLEHVKVLASGERVTRFNALFHWAVPAGREIEAGREVGRFYIMTHAYWREGGPEFRDVNIMGVAHGTEKSRVLQHKAAMDAHLASVGIPVSYTNVFWGGRSEIKPSEISPPLYLEWARSMGMEPASG